MDTSKIVTELVSKITKDDSLLESFKKNAKATVKKLLNVELPDTALDTVVSAVKAKVLGDKVAGAASSIGSLFGKK